MYRKLPTIIILFFFSVALPVTVKAQDNIIAGTVMEAGGGPIHYATVILQTEDSEFVDAAVTDSLGVFRFNSNLVRYRLIVQHLLYEEKEIDSSDFENGVIYLEPRENTIDDVVVRGERPLVKVTGGILQYDVQQVTLGKVVSNAYDAVLQLPGVREQDGGLVLAGAQGVAVILNGRPTTMNMSQVVELLKQMPANYLETAEVMYSAPPQYHVRGAAINLVLRGFDAGTDAPSWQGEVNGSYSQRFYGNYTAGANLLYTSEKLTADFLYSYLNGTTKSDLDILSRHNVRDSVATIKQHNRGAKAGQRHTGRVGIDLRPDENNTIGFVYNTSILTKGRTDSRSYGNYADSRTSSESTNQLHNISVDYTSGFGFKSGINYTYYRSPETQHFFNTDQDGVQSQFVSDSRQRIDAVMAYADQSHKLKKEWELTYGAKFYYAKDYDYQRYRDVKGDLDPVGTDNTLKEYIYDFYAGLGKNFSQKLSMNLSLTGEYYKFADDDEWSLFPQAQLSYVESANNIIQFSFSSDKQYPSYWEKQDYMTYLNGYTVLQGNPGLKSYNNYSAQLTYIRKQKYIFSLFYSYVPNYSAQLAYQATDRYELVYKTLNWDYDQKLGFVVVVPFKAGSWLDSRFTVQAYYEHAKSDDFFDISFSNRTFATYGGLNNTFNVSTKPDIKIELSGFIMINPIQGLFDLSDVWGVDAGVKWTFADKKAELRLKATDIFDSALPDVRSRRSGQNLNMNVWQDTRNVSLSFSYKFGGYKAKERKEVDRSRFK